VREDVQVGSGVIAEPVVVVDADVAMLDDMARHLLGHRRRCRHLYEESTAVTGEGPMPKEERRRRVRRRESGDAARAGEKVRCAQGRSAGTGGGRRGKEPASQSIATLY